MDPGRPFLHSRVLCGPPAALHVLESSSNYPIPIYLSPASGFFLSPWPDLVPSSLCRPPQSGLQMGAWASSQSLLPWPVGMQPPSTPLPLLETGTWAAEEVNAGCAPTMCQTRSQTPTLWCNILLTPRTRVLWNAIRGSLIKAFRGQTPLGNTGLNRSLLQIPQSLSYVLVPCELPENFPKACDDRALSLVDRDQLSPAPSSGNAACAVLTNPTQHTVGLQSPLAPSLSCPEPTAAVVTGAVVGFQAQGPQEEMGGAGGRGEGSQRRGHRGSVAARNAGRHRSPSLIVGCPHLPWHLSPFAVQRAGLYGLYPSSVHLPNIF